MMKQRVYIETTVISYLTARLSGNPIIAGRQTLTREWWEHRRKFFELVVSELVCKHLANAVHRHRIEAVVENEGYSCPVICTPEELAEE